MDQTLFVEQIKKMAVKHFLQTKLLSQQKTTTTIVNLYLFGIGFDNPEQVCSILCESNSVKYLS